MAIHVRCPACKILLKASEGSEGKSTRCPKCQAKFIITAATSPPVVASSPQPAPVKEQSKNLGQGVSIMSLELLKDDISPWSHAIMSGIVTGVLAGLVGGFAQSPGAFLIAGGAGYAVFINWLKPNSKRFVASFIAFSIGSFIIWLFRWLYR